MGGEKNGKVRAALRWKGSPPRGRGKGILCLLPRSFCRDHPRVGGEKDTSLFHSVAVWGSPPRGRGKGVSYILLSEKFRITPAWAGKSQCQSEAQQRRKDHPRVGGEKGSFIPSMTPAIGSPPRGRGKATALPDCKRKLRITPAWAGKSKLRRKTAQAIRDHPRVGGEKFTGFFINQKIKGSPPRGRGKG